MSSRSHQRLPHPVGRARLAPAARTATRLTTPTAELARRASAEEWIPLVANRGWLVVTRDTNISKNRAELAAVRESGARVVAVSGAEATTTWRQLEIVMSRWRSIEDLAGLPGAIHQHRHPDSAEEVGSDVSPRPDRPRRFVFTGVTIRVGVSPLRW